MTWHSSPTQSPVVPAQSPAVPAQSPVAPAQSPGFPMQISYYSGDTAQFTDSVTGDAVYKRGLAAAIFQLNGQRLIRADVSVFRPTF